MHFSNLFPPESSSNANNNSGSNGSKGITNRGNGNSVLGTGIGGVSGAVASASPPSIGALTEFSKWHLLIRMNVENDICFVKGEAKVFSPTPSLATPLARGIAGNEKAGTTSTTSSSGTQSPSSSAVRVPNETIPVWQKDRRCQVLIEGTFRFCDFSDQASAFRLEVRLERLERVVLGLPPGPDLENVILSCGGHRACGWHMGVVQVTASGKEIHLSPLPLHFLLKPYFGQRCSYCLDPVYAFGYSCGACEVTHYCSRACMRDHMSKAGGHGLLCPLLKRQYSIRSGSVATEVNDDTRLVAWWRCLDDAYFTILVDDQLGTLGCAVEFTLCTLKSAKKEGLQFRFITTADKLSSTTAERTKKKKKKSTALATKAEGTSTPSPAVSGGSTRSSPGMTSSSPSSQPTGEASQNTTTRRREERKGKCHGSRSSAASSASSRSSLSPSSRSSSTASILSASSSTGSTTTTSTGSITSLTSTQKRHRRSGRRRREHFKLPSNEDVIDFACLLFREVNRSAIEEGCISLSSACLSYLFLYSPATEITIQAHMLFYSGFKCEDLGVPLTTIEEYVSFVRPIHSLAVLQLEYALRSSIASEFWRRIRSARDAALSLCAINDSKPCFGIEEMRGLVEQQQCEAMLLLTKIYVIMSTRCGPTDYVEWLKEGERLLRQCLTRRVVLLNDRLHATYCFRLAVYLLLFQDDAKKAEAEQLRRKGEALMEKVEPKSLHGGRADLTMNPTATAGSAEVGGTSADKKRDINGKDLIEGMKKEARSEIMDGKDGVAEVVGRFLEVTPAVVS